MTYARKRCDQGECMRQDLEAEVKRLTEALVTQTRALDDERRRLRAALYRYGEHATCCKAMFTKDHDDCDCGWKAMLGTLSEQQAPRRSLSSDDSFCPSCGHNRDKSSVSSIDHGDFKSCQKCGATWTEIDTEQSTPTSDGDRYDQGCRDTRAVLMPEIEKLKAARAAYHGDVDGDAEL